MGEPGFWDDQTLAAKVGADHARAQRRLELFKAVESEVEDLETLFELSDDDAELAGELDAATDVGRGQRTARDPRERAIHATPL